MGYEHFFIAIFAWFMMLLASFLWSSFYEYNPYKKINKRAKERAENKNYRFNPNRQRSTEVKVSDDVIHLETDIQDIQIYSGTLVVNVSSELNFRPFKFKLAIKPFSLKLFEVEGYKSFDSEGMLVIGTEDLQTKTTLLASDDLRDMAESIKDELGTTYLYTSRIAVDQADSAIDFYGNFDDQNEFHLRVEHEAFKLKIKAPLASLKNKLNFGDFEKLGDTIA